MPRLHRNVNQSTNLQKTILHMLLPLFPRQQLHAHLSRFQTMAFGLVTKFLTDREDQINSALPDSSDGLERVEATDPSVVSACNGAFSFNAVYIPACFDKELCTISLPATPDVYYLDAIAHELGLQDAGHVFMSRYVFSSCIMML
jgi:hypothetical protein